MTASRVGPTTVCARCRRLFEHLAVLNTCLTDVLRCVPCVPQAPTRSTTPWASACWPSAWARTGSSLRPARGSTAWPRCVGPRHANCCCASLLQPTLCRSWSGYGSAAASSCTLLHPLEVPASTVPHSFAGFHSLAAAGHRVRAAGPGVRHLHGRRWATLPDTALLPDLAGLVCLDLLH